jgi:predicted glycosyltransferase
MENSTLQEHTLLELVRLQKKIAVLEQLHLLKNWKNIRIVFEAYKDFKQDFIILDQFVFPFQLEQELKNLIEDSIDQLNRDIETLKFKLKNL